MSMKSRSGASLAASQKSNRSHTSSQRSKSTHSLSGAGQTWIIPYCTILLAAVCVAIFAEVVELPKIFQVKGGCLGLYQVFYLQEYMRLLGCHFIHADIWELVLQLASLAWKGYHLERSFGSKHFLLMVLVFAPFCSMSLAAIHKILADVLDAAFITQCFCGLGAINFALKVVKMYQTGLSGFQCAFGDMFCVNIKYITWAEVMISYYMSSTTTLAANAAGVLVGLLYISGILRFAVQFLVNLTSGDIGGMKMGMPNIHIPYFGNLAQSTSKTLSNISKSSKSLVAQGANAVTSSASKFSILSDS